MRDLIAAAGMLVLAQTLSAHEIGDGIYKSSRDATAPLIRTQDGREARLGAVQTLHIQKGDLFSQNNENTRFCLSLTIPYDAGLGPSSYVLVVAGTAYVQSGSGAAQQKTSSLYFTISGAERAEQVSKFLGVPVFHRRHPRHNLLVTFTPAEQEFAIGDEVKVTLRIENVGTDAVSFLQGGRKRAARDNQYIFCARRGGKQVADIGTSYHFGGLAARRTLKPGAVFKDKIELRKWFSFQEPGTYEIHGSYYLDFHDLDDDWSRTIWEDYASADFIVNIK